MPATPGRIVRPKSAYDKRRDESAAYGQTRQQHGVDTPQDRIRPLLNPVFDSQPHRLNLVPGDIGFFQLEKQIGDRLSRPLLQPGIAQ